MQALMAAALLAAPIGIWHDARTHLMLRHPAALHVTTQQLTGITDPVERVALYSGDPPNAMVRPRPRQVIAIVMEQEPPLDLTVFPRRPQHFHLRRLGMLEGFDGRWGEIIFRDHQRAFYLFIGVGTRAGGQVAGLLKALDSLRIGRA
jgi:hypothetical protein